MKKAQNEKRSMGAMLAIYQCQHLVQKYNYIKEINLEVNPRLSRCLGLAIFDKNTIELSSRILADTYENVREIFIHEICHFVAYREFNHTGHGESFKMLMKKHWNSTHKGRFLNGKLITEHYC